MIKRYLFAAPLALAGAAFFYWVALPWPILLRWRDPGRTAFMAQRVDHARAQRDTLAIQQTWVPLDHISRNLRRAVIVAEDGNFYEHNGIDWGALAEELRYRGDDEFSPFDPRDLRAVSDAIRYYLSNRERIRGRSTITQQLAKNLYLSEDRSLLRKLDEFLIAQRLEWCLSKDRILELYLNVAEWGPGIFGAQAAARHYYDRDAADLTREQAAALAATLPHPLTSNPNRRPGRMEWRKQLILRRMPGSGRVRTVPLDSTIPQPPPSPTLPVLPDTLAPPVRDTTDTLQPPPVRRDTTDTLRPPPVRRDTTDTLRLPPVRRDTTDTWRFSHRP